MGSVPLGPPLAIPLRLRFEVGDRSGVTTSLLSASVMHLPCYKYLTAVWKAWRLLGKKASKMDAVILAPRAMCSGVKRASCPGLQSECFVFDKNALGLLRGMCLHVCVFEREKRANRCDGKTWFPGHLREVRAREGPGASGTTNPAWGANVGAALILHLMALAPPHPLLGVAISLSLSRPAPPPDYPSCYGRSQGSS